MSASDLRTALQFGGSGRFNDRNGSGRFGMGLPNSSLSQARRLEVFTWQKHKQVLCCHLDADEIAQGKMSKVPAHSVAAHDPLFSVPDGTRAVAKQFGTELHYELVQSLRAFALP